MAECSAYGEVLDPILMGSEHESANAPAGERRLIRAARRGSEDAIEALVRMHWRGAYATALGVSGDAAAAEDISQEGILSAIRSLHRFDSSRPFAPWLHRIVVNRALDWLRSRQTRAEVAIDPRHEETAASARRDGFSDELIDALRSLEDRDRTIVVLRHVGGFSSKEIGDLLDLSPTAVRSALRRALERLRDQLGRDDTSTAFDGTEPQL